ncbi:hypothetical protein [Nonomuraea insulae]|uniref:Uncharacterized protein n=1 Tax=Nonomuraea insulae TaxID=1616787 RepID=A0ABW1D7L7_9ACTN
MAGPAHVHLAVAAAASTGNRWPQKYQEIGECGLRGLAVGLSALLVAD